MEKTILENLLRKFKGATFASMDTETFPLRNNKSVYKLETNKRVILFQNPHYEDMVKRRLTEAGKDPDGFSLGEPVYGGVRIPGTPLIEYAGKTYLQVIELAQGDVKFMMLGKEYDPRDLGIKARPRTRQGLPPGEEVIVRSYLLQNIMRITLMGETITAEKRSILKLKI